MSHMQAEIVQISEIVKKQLDNYGHHLPAVLAEVHKFSPSFIMTLGRGSSDHAANFAKYVFETELGLVTASAAPSIETIYHAPLQLDKALVVAFSQSGQSTDLCEVMQAAKNKKAFTLAFVNDVDSPLAKIADHIIPLYAGLEISVAATKSFMATLVAILAFTAYWKKNNLLLKSLSKLPDYFVSPQFSEKYLSQIQSIAKAENILILGRGFTFPIAMEAALKLKETCQLHAEAFSSAEVLHGPFALMKKDFPLIVFVPTDAAVIGLENLLERLKKISTRPYLMIAEDQRESLCASSNEIFLPHSLHPLCDPIIAIQAFYLLAEHCARLRHTDPDKPNHLTKVTNTR